MVMLAHATEDYSKTISRLEFQAALQEDTKPGTHAGIYQYHMHQAFL